VIDLHTHTLFSDGALLPFELARRAEAAGYKAIALTDHVDSSNLDSVVPALVKAAVKLRGQMDIDVIPGAELTHIPPALMAGLVEEARGLGAAIVIVHGETLVEPVADGTNRAGIEAGADILSHPGLVSDDDARLAAEKGVALEISTRKGHSLSNAHVARAALRHGATLVLNNDSHEPGDLVSRQLAEAILMGAGLSAKETVSVLSASRTLADKALRRF
jgi:histidinol phosphatase-like PHP family hydrolase